MSRARGKLHEIAVTASKSGGGTSFAAGSDLWDDPNGALRFHKDHHGMRKHDYHLVEFVLDDQTGDGLRFPSVPHDAMWVSKVGPGRETPCPNKDTESDYSVLEPICVSDDGRRLIVRNDNPQKEQWAFTMNFVKRGEDAADPDKFVSWDPIIDNHNGGV
ncbi:MAG TPA: hypothetical protein VIV07_03345 [Sphingomicrobium sp.]